MKYIIYNKKIGLLYYVSIIFYFRFLHFSFNLSNVEPYPVHFKYLIILFLNCVYSIIYNIINNIIIICYLL
jgi:hypothetical protein